MSIDRPETIEEVEAIADRYYPGPMILTPTQIEALRIIFTRRAA